MGFRIGQTVVMSEAAIENYGEQWRDVKLTVDHCATKYMPAKDFYAQGKPKGYHPGYDTGLSPMGLYDLTIKATGEPLNFSLYTYELESI